MSSWTAEEVLQLTAAGNDHCRNTWLADAPPIGQGGRPAAGMPISVFKQFVMDAYEHRKYYGQAPVAPAAVAAPTPVPAPAPVVAPPVSAPAVADLLDFSAASPAPAASTPSFAADFTSAPAASSFAADFAQVSAPPASVSSTPAPPSMDPFSPQPMAVPAALTASSSFGFINSAPEPAKKPIMGGNNPSAAAISGMGNSSVFSNPKKSIPNMMGGMMNNQGGMTGPSMSMNGGMMNGGMNGMTMNGAMNGMNMQGGMNSFGNNLMNGSINGMMPQGIMMGQPTPMANNGGMGQPGMTGMGMMGQQPMMMMNGRMMGNTMMQGVNQPVMNHSLGGNAISGMTSSVKQQTQKKKDAFSDLMPF